MHFNSLECKKIDVPALSQVRQARRFFDLTDQAGNKDLDADEDENDSPQDSCFVGKSRASLFSDGNARKANKKGDGADQKASKKSLPKVIIGNGKANGKSIDGGGNALHD